ncbi:MAG: response regulator transcription factor [Planctomycetota bacterium]|jgi:CheY-like chemotaxis protein
MKPTGHVLVVEDEPLSRDVLMRLLQGKDYEVDSVPDGPAAMEWLEQRTPDVVLLDVSMPGLSGLDVLRWIRRRHTSDQLPVILVSALIDSDDVVAGLDAGANDYVVKPVNPAVLLARISASLRLKRNVERLVEAERHRVMLEAISDACRRLARPVDAMISGIDQIMEETPATDDRLRRHIEDLRNWARQAASLIEKFHTVARYAEVPYTEGVGGFVSATLESDEDDGDDGDDEESTSGVRSATGSP